MICKIENIIKKSKFIGIVVEIQQNDNIKDIIKKYKEIYHDATHVCYGYITNFNNSENAGYSDDGEPKNTAGKPIYETLKLKKAYNVIVFVVRYYGGKKLGAGPLIRAYREATSDAINLANQKGA
ncbi:IMPACT family protein [Mycoplasma nasistruthionis]|uniref:YigZ family protein n=1 Tax=Mycoplasma nasistruthionis TaxID=353852 RepID=A0A5B7XWQ7_9MOLU|nr:YigZ family protein [Mycoplasma nasistruthionis]QCZ36970.1 YigZ family protein [Mycoplasma nasistruthionis]